MNLQTLAATILDASHSACGAMYAALRRDRFPIRLERFADLIGGRRSIVT
jgi:hypothetical protein